MENKECHSPVGEEENKTCSDNIKDSMSSVLKIIGIEGDDKEKAMKGVEGFFDMCSGLGIDISSSDKPSKPLSFLNDIKFKKGRSMADVAIETINEFNHTKKKLQTILEILSPDELKIVEEQCDLGYTDKLLIMDTKIDKLSDNLSEHTISIEEKLDNIELNLDIVITKISKL